MTEYKTIHGSAHNIDLPDQSVHAIITSPPYFNLRAYHGDQDVTWPAMSYAPMPNMPHFDVPAMTCALGAEPTIEAYIGHLVLCLREWWRVLRGDGVLFCNLGDSYNGSGGAGGDYNDGGNKAGQPKFKGAKQHGLKPKDLCLIPERFRMAAQADGWYVRSVFPWIKRNAMPNSQKDRPTTSHEDWVMLTKSPTYFWDQESIKVAAVAGYNGSTFTNGKTADARSHLAPIGKGERRDTECISGRYRRTADWTFDSIDIAISEAREWASQADHALNAQTLMLDEDGAPICMPVNPRPYKGAHYAVFPEPMIEPLVQAATSAHGVCRACGSPWARVVEREGGNWEQRKKSGHPIRYGLIPMNGHNSTCGVMSSTTTGWQPTCTCNADIVPATVLDPFAGSGTTLRVAMRLGRNAIGVDVSDVYLSEHVEKRVGNLQFEMSF